MILPDNAPWVLHWIEWCLYAYWGSLPVCLAVVIAHKAYACAQYQYPPPLFSGWHEVPLILLVTFSLWVLVCVVRNGYGLG